VSERGREIQEYLKSMESGEPGWYKGCKQNLDFIYLGNKESRVVLNPDLCRGTVEFGNAIFPWIFTPLTPVGLSPLLEVALGPEMNT
jgi:hypothetical protein